MFRFIQPLEGEGRRSQSNSTDSTHNRIWVLVDTEDPHPARMLQLGLIEFKSIQINIHYFLQFFFNIYIYVVYIHGKYKMNRINEGILLIWTKISLSYISYLTSSIDSRGHETQRSDKAHRITSWQKIPKPNCSRTTTDTRAPSAKSWLCLVAPCAHMETPALLSRHRVTARCPDLTSYLSSHHTLSHCCADRRLRLRSIAVKAPSRASTNRHGTGSHHVNVQARLVGGHPIVTSPGWPLAVVGCRWDISDWKEINRASSQPTTEQQPTGAFQFKPIEIVAWNLSLVY